MRKATNTIQIMELDEFPVYLTFKNVKNINITIKSDRINVSAPWSVPISEVKEIINENRIKYLKQARKLSQRAKEIKEITLPKIEDLHSVLLFGRDREIDFNDEINNIKLASKRILIPAYYKFFDYPTFIEKLDEFIQGELEHYIDNRLKYWYKKTGLKCSKYSIRKMKTRWGSCTYQSKTIRFNFYLAMLPKDLIDYVIIHELCHLKEPNHQKGFYDLLYKFDPHYESQRKTLKNIAVLPIYFS